MRSAPRRPGDGQLVAAGNGGRTVDRVVLIDDHALFRAGVRSELEGRVEIVGEAGTVEEAVALIEQTKPDVALLDVHMPDGGGVAVARRCPDTCFLALSV